MKDNNTIIHFEELNWKQIEDLDRKKTVFFQPISLLEEHGPHLPVGMDYLTSRDLAVEAIKILNKKNKDLTCILLPPLPIGHCRANSDFPGTITTDGKVIKKIIYSIASSLGQYGFKYLIILSWHLDFTHLKAIHQGINKAMRKYDIKIYEPTGPHFWNSKVDVWDEELKKKGYNIDFDPEKQMHAGHRETSIMKYQYPYLVDKIHTKLPTVYVDLSSPKCHGKYFKEMGIKDGYVGSPSKANEEYGKLHFQDMANLYANLTMDLIEGKKLPELPGRLKRAMKLPFF